MYICQLLPDTACQSFYKGVDITIAEPIRLNMECSMNLLQPPPGLTQISVPAEPIRLNMESSMNLLQPPLVLTQESLKGTTQPSPGSTLHHPQTHTAITGLNTASPTDTHCHHRAQHCITHRHTRHHRAQHCITHMQTHTPSPSSTLHHPQTYTATTGLDTGSLTDPACHHWA